MYEPRGSKKGMEDNIVYSPLLLSNGNHLYLYPQYVEDFLLVVHSALIFV